MKKIISAFLVTVMLACTFVTGISAQATSTPEGVTCNFDSGVKQYPNGGTCATSTGNAGAYIGDSGNGIQLKTMSSAMERRTVLSSFDNEATLPAGTYTFSFWVRQTTNTSDWCKQYYNNNTQSEIAFSLYGSDVTDDDNLALDDGCVIKLLPKDTSELHFNLTGKTTTTFDTKERTWYEYSATVTTDKEYTKFAFWMLGAADSQSLYTYVDNLSITPASAAEFRGVQESAKDSGKTNIRFVGTLTSLEYSSVGFDISCAYPGGEKPTAAFSCDTVYTSITANENGMTKTYTATDFGEVYIYAVTITGAPAEGTVTFVVTPYTVSLSGEKISYDAYTVTYTDGECTDIVKN